MNSDYNQLEKLVTQRLSELRCDDCKGRGEKDDVGLGDMYCNTWTCKTCGGIGIKPGEVGVVHVSVEG